MKHIVCIGDSITSGENNNFVSYVPKLQTLLGSNYSVEGIGISGITLDNYSIYPVGYDESILSLILKNKSTLSTADIIVLEFGVNDASALTVKNVTFRQVAIALTKVLDAISQINSSAKIYFLSNTPQYIPVEYALEHCQYLQNYFDGIFTPISPKEWLSNYKSICTLVGSREVFVVPMYESGFQLYEYLSEDRIHPTDAGYEVIARNVAKRL